MMNKPPNTAFDRFIAECGFDRGALKAKMAELELEDEGYKKNHTKEEYNKELEHRTRKIEPYISKCANPKKKSNLELRKVSLIKRALDCSYDELIPIILNKDCSDYESEKNKISDGKLLAQGYKFRCLEVYFSPKYHYSYVKGEISFGGWFGRANRFHRFTT
jgi:hypothetical protein